VEQIILVVHLLVALAIIGLIMMQQGKGSDIGASFGGGASQTLFGSAGSANILTKMTAWLAVLFFITSFGLAMIADSKTSGTDELGFELPEDQLVLPAQGAEGAAPVGDLPVVDDVTESAMSVGDMPTVPAESTDADAPSGDLPLE
jgi:preprotein translocase subunit SecG